MLRHVVVLTWREGTTPAQVAAVTAALESLPARISVLRTYHVGPDAGLDAGNQHYAIVADFDVIEDFLTYRDHPDHQAVIREHIRPIVATRAAVQYEL